MPPATHPTVNLTRCSPSSISSGGYGLFATQKIEAGDLIARFPEPFLAVLDSPFVDNVCFNCFILVGEDGSNSGWGDPNFKLSKCAGCKVASFCGKACQTQSWKRSHKHTCKVFKTLYPKLLPNTVRMAMDVLLRRKNMSLPEDEWAAFQLLEDHTDHFRRHQGQGGAESWQNIQLMAKAAKEYSQCGESLSYVETLICRILTNTLTLTTPLYNPIGLLLHPTLAQANHSCRPNAVISYSESTPSLRALGDISAESEIFISYIDITNGTFIRQKELENRYFFLCACPECTARTTLGQPDVPPNLPDSLGEKAFQELIDTGLGTRELAKERRRKESKPNPDIYREGLAIYSPLKSFFPVYRQPFALLRIELAATLVEAREFVEAFRHSLIEHFSIDPVHFQQPFHPVRVVHTWVLLRLAVNMKSQIFAELIKHDTGVDAVMGGKGLDELKRLAVDWDVITFMICREVAENVDKSHGVESVFAMKVKRIFGRMGVWDSTALGTHKRHWKKLRKWAAEVE